MKYFYSRFVFFILFGLLVTLTLFSNQIRFSSYDVYSGYIYPGNFEDFDVPTARRRLADEERHFKDVERSFIVAQQKFQNVKNNRDKKQKELNNTETQIKNLQNEIQNLNNKEERLRNQIATKERTIDTNRNQINAASSEISTVNNNISSNERKRDELKNRIQILRSEVQGLEREVQQVCASNPEGERCKQKKLMLQNKKQRLNGLNSELSQIDGTINNLQARRTRLENNINKLRNDNKRLLTEVQNLKQELANIPNQIQNKTVQLNNLRSRLPQLRQELNTLNQRVEAERRNFNEWNQRYQMASNRLDRAKENLRDVRRNYDNAYEHAESAGKRFGETDGSLEGGERGEPDGENYGYNLGSEVGREEGIAHGIAEARRLGTAQGKEEGRELGISEGQEQAREEGTRDGTFQGWRDRGYSDGYELAYNNPDKNDARYKNAYVQGKQNAYAQAHETHYPKGVEKAEKEYFSYPLSQVELSNGTYKDVSRSVRTAQLSLKNMESVSNKIKLSSDIARALSSFAKGRDLTSKKTKDITNVNLNGQLSLEERIRYDDNFFLPIPRPNPNGAYKTWYYTYYQSNKVIYPHPEIQNHFEEIYRREYKNYAVYTYDNSYTEAYYEAFKMAARIAYNEVSDPALYPEERQEAYTSAKAYWREKYRVDTYNELYPSFYDSAREEARENPNTNSSEYKTSYVEGTTDGLVKIGTENGFSESIVQAQIDEELKGYKDRVDYFKNNAVLKVAGFSVVDGNKDNIFAVGEQFDFQVAIENYGLKVQIPGTLRASFSVKNGPAESVIDDIGFVAIPGQSRAYVSNVLKGKVLENANIGDAVSGDIVIYNVNGNKKSELARYSYNFTLKYPMELKELLLGDTIFTNSDNFISGKIKNISSKPSPAGIDIIVENSFVKDNAFVHLPAIDAGQSADFKVPFQVDEKALFEKANFVVKATSASVLQVKSDELESFVSKRFIKEADVLFVADNFRDQAWKKIRDNIWKISQSNFDVLDLSAEDVLEKDHLLPYSGGFVLAQFKNIIIPTTEKAVLELLAHGGHILLAGVPVLANSKVVKYLEKRKISIDERVEGVELKGDNVFDGEKFSWKTNQKRIELKVKRPADGIFSKLSFLNYKLLKPNVAARTVDFKNTGATVNIITDTLNSLSDESLETFLTRIYFLELAVEEKIMQICALKQIDEKLKMHYLTAILYEILEEIDADKNFSKKDRIYNPDYNDITTTSLYKFQDLVLSSSDCVYYKDLLFLYRHMHRKVESDMYAKPIVKELKKEFLNQGGTLPQ